MKKKLRRQHTTNFADDTWAEFVRAVQTGEFRSVSDLIEKVWQWYKKSKKVKA